MTRSVAQKMGLRPQLRTLLVDAPVEAVTAIGLPELDLRTRVEDGPFGYVHVFARDQVGLDAVFPRMTERLAEGGMLWVSWPKGRQLGTDLTLQHVIRIGYSHGLVESTTLAVDQTWSAIKFTRPKPGKAYRNSYGQLPTG